MFTPTRGRLLLIALASGVLAVWGYSAVLLLPTGEVYAAHDRSYWLLVLTVSVGLASGAAGLCVSVFWWPQRGKQRLGADFRRPGSTGKRHVRHK